MITEITALYSITDDLLKAIGHSEDCRVQMSDAEVVSAALVAARFFNGNQKEACEYLKEEGYMPKMLDPSRFCRRLHRLFLPLLDLFDYLGMILKSMNETAEYLLDSFPVAVCDNIRIGQCQLVHGEDYRGYIASKKRYFYGIRVHLLSTKEGIPVEFTFLPGEANDTRGLKALPLNLPEGSSIYTDAGYTDYLVEDNMKEADNLNLQVMRKRNSKRQDAPWVAYLKQVTRHYIETVFSAITCRFPKNIHAVTMDGFLLKITMFIMAIPSPN